MLAQDLAVAEGVRAIAWGGGGMMMFNLLYAEPSGLTLFGDC